VTQAPVLCQKCGTIVDTPIVCACCGLVGVVRTPDQVVDAWVSQQKDPEYSEVMGALRQAIGERNLWMQEHAKLLKERTDRDAKIAEALALAEKHLKYLERKP